MSLKIKIQLWMNVQLWTYRPQFSGRWGGGKFSCALMECVVTSPASPGSLSYPGRGDDKKELDKALRWPSEVLPGP